MVGRKDAGFGRLEWAAGTIKKAKVPMAGRLGKNPLTVLSVCFKNGKTT
jgi:hypothetical protein